MDALPDLKRDWDLPNLIRQWFGGNQMSLNAERGMLHAGLVAEVTGIECSAEKAIEVDQQVLMQLSHKTISLAVRAQQALFIMIGINSNQKPARPKGLACPRQKCDCACRIEVADRRAWKEPKNWTCPTLDREGDGLCVIRTNRRNLDPRIVRCDPQCGGFEILT